MAFFQKIYTKYGLRHVKNFIYIYSTCYVINKHLGEFIVCRGDSMEPTLSSGDLVIAQRKSVKNHELEKGDIVCSLSPTDPRILLCKRIAFMPADKVRMIIYSSKLIKKFKTFLNFMRFGLDVMP